MLFGKPFIHGNILDDRVCCDSATERRLQFIARDACFLK